MSMDLGTSFYALLEIDPGATEDDIRRAYKRLVKLFDAEGPVVYGLYPDEEVQTLSLTLREAYETLIDPDKRRRYDRGLFPEGHPSLRRADQREAASQPRRRPEPPADPLAALDLPETTPLKGATILRVREVCHLSLQDIAERTKISMFTLRCIEGEQYADLPARVYLRGFLRQIADMLRLDPDRLIRDYLAAYDEWQRTFDTKSWPG
jgi:curved DNA-binding protein CbpA